MRNLKRALSLALAAIMVLGMMVIGAGAENVYDSFPDKEEIVNKDAVSMLTTLGIINGEDSGKFNPTGNVTRSQMAKMISVIMNKGADNNALYADVNSGLTDIGSSWAKGHINFCFTRGIIAGRGDGKFDPEANVTAAEAAKMLLVAAGYDPAKEGFTGGDWAVNVSAMASKLGVYNNYEKSTMDPLSRDDAALLIYNALDVEMIQKYDSNYPINFSDHRTILSVMYGVYKVEGVVTSNEWAALNGTDKDAVSPAGKTTMDEVKVYKSTTENTANGIDYDLQEKPVVFNVPTTVDMLGKTVTLYVKKTTVLSNSTVLGAFLKEDNNVVKTVTDSQDTMKDVLKDTSLTTDTKTEYYVNYGKVANEAAATKAMGFATTAAGNRFTSLNDNGADVKTNATGVDMTVIDNDGDGVVDYVLYLQETLSQVLAVNSSKETTILNDFNKNKAIDNDKIVTEDTLAESDLVLVLNYGDRYYVSAPEVVTGKMDTFSSSKTKQQYIEVGGTKYNPSYIGYAADAANNTYVFNVLNCGKSDGVDFDIDYDFILDSNGNVIAYRPSEKSLYNYALILDSGYDAGRTSSNPTGEVKVLLPDGTEGTYTLNFGASAQNIGDQLYNGVGTASNRKDNGIIELKGFLGTAGTDNTDTKPLDTTTMKNSVAHHYSDVTTINAAGHAKGYVIGYSLNDKNVLTITSIVGSNNTIVAKNGHYNPTLISENPRSIDSILNADYSSSSARVKYAGDQLTIDQNTVAFYYKKEAGKNAVYGVAVGYSKMADVKKGVDFVATTVKNASKDTSLAATILFEDEGVVAEKDYAYVLGRSTSDSNNVTLNVVLMDGTGTTLKISRSDFDSIFTNSDRFNTVYSYTTKNEVSELTYGVDNAGVDPSTKDVHAVAGYAVKLRDGTLALYKKNADGSVGAYVDAYSYEKNIWDVQDTGSGENAIPGAFAQNVYKEVVLVLDAKENTVRAGYIKKVLSGVVADGTHDFDWNLGEYKDAYPSNTLAEVQKMLNDGYNVKMNGSWTLTGNMTLANGHIFYATGSLNESGNHIYGNGQVWVYGDYTTSGSITVKTQVNGDLILANNTTIYSTVAVNDNIRGSGKDLTIASDANVYVTNDVLQGTGAAGGDLIVNGHIDARNYQNKSGTVGSSHTLIARGTYTGDVLTIGSGSSAGAANISGTLSVGRLELDVGTLTANGGQLRVTTLITANGTTLNAKDLTVDGNSTVNGDANVSGSLQVATAATLTVGATGSLTTSKTDTKTAGYAGAVDNKGEYVVTDADKDSTANIKGELSGDQASNVTLTDSTTVPADKEVSIDGKLDLNGKTLTVKGDLTLNGKDIVLNDSITGTSGATISFGGNATVTTDSAKLVYSDGTKVDKGDLAGKTFTYSTATSGVTAGKFVCTSDGRDTADVTFKVHGESNVYGGATKTISISAAANTKSLVLDATMGANQTIAPAGTDKNSVSVSGDTITVSLNGSSKSFDLVVSEQGKSSITYSVTITVRDSGVAGNLPNGIAVVTDDSGLALAVLYTGTKPSIKDALGYVRTYLAESNEEVGNAVPNADGDAYTIAAGGLTYTFETSAIVEGVAIIVNGKDVIVPADLPVNELAAFLGLNNVGNYWKITKDGSTTWEVTVATDPAVLTDPTTVVSGAAYESGYYKVTVGETASYYKSGDSVSMSGIDGEAILVEYDEKVLFVNIADGFKMPAYDVTITGGFNAVTGVTELTSLSQLSAGNTGYCSGAQLNGMSNNISDNADKHQVLVFALGADTDNKTCKLSIKKNGTEVYTETSGKLEETGAHYFYIDITVGNVNKGTGTFKSSSGALGAGSYTWTVTDTITTTTEYTSGSFTVTVAASAE